MPFIDKIKLPGSQNAYEIHDSGARDAIASLSGGSYFLGVTTTAIADQSTTNPVTINGESVTAINGNMVIYGSSEFVWSCTSYTYYSKTTTSDNPPKYYYTVIANPSAAQKEAAIFVNVTVPTTSGTAVTTPLADGADIIKHEAAGKWVEFGDLTTLGDLAYYDNVVLNKNTTSVVCDLDYKKITKSNLVTDTLYKGTVVESIHPTSKKLSTSHLSTSSFTPYVPKTVSIPNVTGNTSVTANKSTWGFAMGSGNDATTLIISGGNGSDVSATNTTLGTAFTANDIVTGGTPIAYATGSLSTSGAGDAVATGAVVATTTSTNVGATIVESVEGTPTSALISADNITVATGSLASNGTGSTVVTGLATPASGDTELVATGVKDTDTVLNDATSISLTND